MFEGMWFRGLSLERVEELLSLLLDRRGWFGAFTGQEDGEASFAVGSDSGGKLGDDGETACIGHSGYSESQHMREGKKKGVTCGRCCICVCNGMWRNYCG